MPGPIAATGAISNPTRYGALTMAGEQFTGLWTQRSPYRDAASAYLVKKFYQGSRFDSMIDGLNREITVALTDKRRPGSGVYNSNTFPAAQSFFAHKTIQNGLEKINVIMDGADGNIYDATAGQKATLFTKSAGAKKTRFLSVATEMFFGDGVDTNKWLTPGAWTATTNVLPGTLINTGAKPGVLQMALGGISLPIVATSSDGSTVTIWVNPENVPLNFPNLVSASIAFSGLTSATYLNGHSYPVASIISTTLGIFTITLSHSVYAETTDSGTGSTGNGTTGGTAPAFSSSEFTVVADSGQQWKCYGTAIENWGLAAPTNTPTLTPQNGTRFWRPGTTVPAGYAILDSNGDVEISSGGVTGNTYPQWNAQIQNAETGVVSATQNAGLAASRSFYGTANPDTTPPTAGSVYQNATAYAMVVAVSGDLGGGGFHGVVYCDSSTSPTTAVAQFSRVNAGSSAPNYYPGSVTFVVPPGFYYGISVTSGSGAPFIRTWTEYLLNGAMTSLGTGSGSTGASGGPTATQDGTQTWTNWGKAGSWFANTSYAGPWSTIAPVGVILDSNFNWQYITAGSGGLSGSTQPTWATSIGATTTDGALTWTCLGPGVVLSYKTTSYSFSTHGVDGSLSTAAQANIIPGGIVGPPAAPLESYIQIGGSFAADTQIDQIWLWRTAQGQATLLLEDQIPADGLSGSFTYNEIGIPDTSVAGGGALNAFIQAPIAKTADPPPAGFTGPVYYLQRVWGFSGNTVNYSAGPDAIASTGNGATAFPPLNEIPFPGAVIKLRPITVQNGGLLVYTSSGIWIVLGLGTPGNPFYATSYCSKVNLAGYDAEDIFGSMLFLMESNGKVASLEIQYPFNPQSGYSEIGLPIGDQFLNVTTGGISSALYNPATAFLSWCVANTKDTGMYVADGTVGWFRMGAVSPPESGLVWSPRAAIAGGTSAAQSVETAPALYAVLIGAPSGTPGPILMRDQTGANWQDNGTSFDAYDTKGVNLLCSTGQWTEVAHIAAKSAAVGARPQISVLLGEIAASTERPWNLLAVTSPDPADTPPSKSVFSDRYGLAQNGVADTSDCLLTRFDYGAQAFGDELLDWGIFASTDEERKEEAAK